MRRLRRERGAIARAFERAKKEKRAAFVPFLMAGDPDLATTTDLVVALAEAGADVVELGVPFSDPIADGPVNQAAAERALASGATLEKILATVAGLRTRTDVAIVLFSYFNPIHRYGPGFYPGTGAAEETGKGKGLGYTLNVPVKFGTPRKDYHDLFTGALEKAADKIKPELVLLSAGFDPHVKDPIGSLGLETEDFPTLTKRVLEVAKTHAGGRLISCLEGGYNLGALARSVASHLRVLAEV